ncbi:phosphatidate cytidylyltransferase, mitochondrial isoform X1 [Iris pallida]|uniref:Phosphatidate cytidylyltransferase, mitochondrial n=1 Tax=Iris pallida TaxID=29817 RepID=A0AAX6ER45_IRIPA|nr:phosphatidate cytidylyltransferase, mitochondrial isoform X1 [Iris pallida]
MDSKLLELAGPLQSLPPVDFCCVYGSSLLPNNEDKTSMVDYILGVADPLQWHSDNLDMNRDHYSKWMARFGPKVITRVTNGIGVGVHFNPFVEWKDKKIKYGVVGMQDLAQDILTWKIFYLSGRLQKPVRILVDNWDIRKVNIVNLKAATSAALLLSKPEFTEEDLYANICSLSYMGDLRMLFAEDKNKVKKIVHGSFESFGAMYKPMLQEYVAAGLLNCQHYASKGVFKQDCGLSATSYLLSTLPCIPQSQMAVGIGGDHGSNGAGGVATQPLISSRQEAANHVRKVLRRTVRASSLRQALSGFLAAGGSNAARYLTQKMSKSWKSRMLT